MNIASLCEACSLVILSALGYFIIINPTARCASKNIFPGMMDKAEVSVWIRTQTWHNTHITLWSTLRSSPLWLPVRPGSPAVQPLLSLISLNSFSRLCLLVPGHSPTNCTQHKTWSTASQTNGDKESSMLPKEEVLWGRRHESNHHSSVNRCKLSK